MGTASVEQFREFAGAVIRSLPDNVDSNVMQGWIENQESLRKILREALTPNGEIIKNIFTLSVNYSRTVEDGIKAGKYDWSNSDITSGHFPTKHCPGSEEGVKIELVHFGKNMNTEDVLSELSKKGLRPAELHDLLVLGEKHSDLQREFPIIALGSVWQAPDGNRRVPYLYGHGSERSLDLSWVGSRWIGSCRFAAVRK